MNKAAAFLPLLFLFMCGCLATSGNMDNLQRQLNIFNSELKQVREDSQKTQKNQIEINNKMDTLSQSLVEHSEGLKDFNLQMVDMSSRVDDLKVMLAKTLEQKEAAEKIMLPSKLYTEAYSYLLQKNYTRAIEGFSLYIEKYPNGKLAEGAYYNLGDAYSAEKKWDRAAFNYAQILTKHKDSDKIASARLKYAQSLLEMKSKTKTKEALNYLKSIIQDFPSSPEAVIAKEKINKLNRKNKTASKTKK